MENNRLHMIQGVWTNFCRFVLAIVFIFSGFVKGVDPLGTQYKIQDYLEAFGWTSFIPDFVPILASILLAMLEFTLGVYLLFGIRRKLSSVLILLVMLVMTPLTLYLALKNPVSDCGCFGDAWILTNWETFWKNVFLLIAAISVFKWGNRIVRFVSEKSQWLVAVYTLVFIVGVSAYCLYYLPIFDFRPYKIGTNIPQAMSIPEGAKQSVYESVFILEKDGVRKEFTLADYPDSTWTFADSRTIVKEKGYEPAIHDFSIMNIADGEDITEQVLEDKGYTFLLIAHRMSEADDSNIDLINEIYDYSVENGYGFYCLTSSLEEDIEQWKDKTGAEYPFCLTDDITLKTIIRSNPGLLLLKDGTVYRKWSDNNLPDEYVLTDKLDKIEVGQLVPDSMTHTIINVVLWFAIPLLLFIGLDIVIVKRLDGRREKKKKKEEKRKRE